MEQEDLVGMLQAASADPDAAARRGQLSTALKLVRSGEARDLEWPPAVYEGLREALKLGWAETNAATSKSKSEKETAGAYLAEAMELLQRMRAFPEFDEGVAAGAFDSDFQRLLLARLEAGGEEERLPCGAGSRRGGFEL